jgi:hypothetical protein
VASPKWGRKKFANGRMHLEGVGFRIGSLIPDYWMNDLMDL